MTGYNVRMIARALIPTILGLSFATASLTGCAVTPASANPDSRPEPLVGAWRSKVQFASGPFAEVKDLEFLYAFNEGGTMTESSNYDGAPPVPPAYGMWRRIGVNKYEAHYEYFNSSPPKTFEDIANGMGWLPGGRGTIREIVTIASNGKTFKSELTFVLKDQAGKQIAGGGKAVANGSKMSY